MKSCAGCFALILAALFGYAICAISIHLDPGYLDREEAMAQGLDNARAHCEERGAKIKPDCSRVRLSEINEEKDGWWMRFAAPGLPGTDGVFIGRRGEYDAIGSDWVGNDTVAPTTPAVDAAP